MNDSKNTTASKQPSHHLKLIAGDNTYIATVHTDGSWFIAEGVQRMLSVAGNVHSSNILAMHGAPSDAPDTEIRKWIQQENPDVEVIVSSHP